MSTTMKAPCAPPEYPVTWTLGMSANDQGNYERAITFFRAALHTMEERHFHKRQIDVLKARIHRATEALDKSKRLPT